MGPSAANVASYLRTASFACHTNRSNVVAPVSSDARSTNVETTAAVGETSVLTSLL
jgi:hypothetical protein